MPRLTKAAALRAIAAGAEAGRITPGAVRILTEAVARGEDIGILDWPGTVAAAAGGATGTVPRDEGEDADHPEYLELFTAAGAARREAEGRAAVRRVEEADDDEIFRSLFPPTEET